MKNRKNIFVLAIVALILVLGVGYAVVSTQNLDISGATATAKNSTVKVVYNGVNGQSDAQKVTPTAADDSTTATFTITDMVLNTAEYATFQIQNKETDLNAVVHAPAAANITNSNSEYFSVTLYYNDEVWTGDHTLAPGATATIKAVVTLIKSPLTEQNSSTTITVTYTADPAAVTP